MSLKIINGRKLPLWVTKKKTLLKSHSLIALKQHLKVRLSELLVENQKLLTMIKAEKRKMDLKKETNMIRT